MLNLAKKLRLQKSNYFFKTYTKPFGKPEGFFLLSNKVSK